ncbi:hypothetical protein BDV96DRAFT_584921 [Lophiotrema nucula]|uniref:Uncharacterized protein n=1 Tax=Lophiotrema nucula TaxID=690887 RepID=A0A6A5YSM3_9PLEO|nr:hypothetical protein BDV96DRAFT_584921 [Lophiotrema nucula]
MDHYYSATAVTIDFLARLPQARRMRMRKLVLVEDRKGVAYPECHARGLIPYMVENKALRVDIHVGFWTSLVPSVWPLPNLGCNGLNGFLVQFADWIDETAHLTSSGIPSTSLRFLLDGQGTESSELWHKIKYAAGLQEAMACSRYGSGAVPVNLSELDIDMGLDIQPPPLPADKEALIRDQRLQLPSDLPPSFYPTVRQIIKGTGNIHFIGDPGDVWDREQLIAARQDWTFHDYWFEWKRTINTKLVTLPAGGVSAYLKLYRLEARDASGRLWDDVECGRITGWPDYLAPDP